jgi:hypothetical protein
VNSEIEKFVQSAIVSLRSHRVEDRIIEAWTLLDVEVVGIPDTEKRTNVLVDFLQYKRPSNVRISEMPERISNVSKSATDERDLVWVNQVDYLVHDLRIVHVLESKERRERRMRDMKSFGRWIKDHLGDV